MRAWVIRFGSLYVFNIVVLLVIGALLPTVRVGWSVLWASVILTAGVLWLKPLVSRLFRGLASGRSAQRSSGAERLVQWGLVLAVELVLWVVVVWFSGVNVHGWFWGFVLPPVALLIAWAIYSAIDDGLQKRAAALYDKAESRISKD